MASDDGERASGTNRPGSRRVGTAYSGWAWSNASFHRRSVGIGSCVTVGQHAGLIAVATIFLAPFFFVS